MRFLVMTKGTKASEAGTPPTTEEVAAVIAFNEELVRAGVLLAADGLTPSSRGARIRFNGDERTVIDGPFAETKELIAGYWILEVGSKEEAVEWFSRLPNNTPDEEWEVEIRPFLTFEDFDGNVDPALQEKVERMEATAAEQHGLAD